MQSVCIILQVCGMRGKLCCMSLPVMSNSPRAMACTDSMAPHSAGRCPVTDISNTAKASSEGKAVDLPQEGGKLPVTNRFVRVRNCREGKAPGVAHAEGNVPACCQTGVMPPHISTLCLCQAVQAALHHGIKVTSAHILPEQAHIHPSKCCAAISESL